MTGLIRPGLLREPDFRRFFGATVAGQLADRFVYLALPLVAILWLDADEFAVGVLTAMTTAGSLLIGLPAGAWVDRWRKRPVMINTDLLRAALLMTVPLAWWANVLSIWLLYAIALGHGLLTVLFEVGYTSYIPALVGRGHLVEANSRIAAVRSAVSISGPGLAGPLVGWLGAPLTLIVSAAGMLLSALGVQRIRAVEAERPAASRRHLTREVSEGLRFVLGHRLLRPMLVTDGLFSTFLVVYQTMLLVFLARQLDLSTFGIGLVLSVMATGGFTGALLARRLIASIGPGPVIWLAPLCTAPAAALLPATGAGWPLWLAGPLRPVGQYARRGAARRCARRPVRGVGRTVDRHSGDDRRLRPGPAVAVADDVPVTVGGCRNFPARRCMTRWRGGWPPPVTSWC